jgi:hypothetical protein
MEQTEFVNGENLSASEGVSLEKALISDNKSEISGSENSAPSAETTYTEKIRVSEKLEQPAEKNTANAAPKAPEKPAEAASAKVMIKTAAPEKAVSGEEAPRLSDREVMEHTAAMWQYKEIVNDGTELHAEFHQKRTEAAFAEIIAARARGKKHKHEGTNCDDYFETAVTEHCVIVAVCDGAGSKKFSRIGARVCAQTAVDYLKEQLSAAFAEDEKLTEKLSADMSSGEFMDGCGTIAKLVRQSAKEAFSAQQKALEQLCANENYKNALGREPVLSDLSATFLAAVVMPLTIDGERQAVTVSVQIGDGCICTIDSKADSEHCLRLMGEADSGAFSGETDFISEKNTRPEVIGAKTRVGRSKADIVLVMTDGVADDYFPANPMMKRLYLDLCLNGILPMAKGESAEDPAPIRYNSVSMSRQSVALQYAKQLLPKDGDSAAMTAAVNGLWDKREMLGCHSLEAFRMNIGDTPEERLRVWLDNYNERGSFDDRTLAAVILHEDTKP